jgi:putative phosphoribosyl transferase
MLFRDRIDAGRRLAERLSHYVGKPDVVVLALPRGGVPVAAEVARALDAPLDIFLVRKLGLPGQEELAMGAIASGGSQVLNTSLLRRLHVPPETINAVALRELRELDRRERAYRGPHAPPAVRGKTVILVDDGLATGASMHAAVAALRAQGPARIVVAVPVGAPSTCEDLHQLADEVVCAEMPEPFSAVGQWYDDFSQTSDEEVRQLLEASRKENPGRARRRARADVAAPGSGPGKGAFHF